DTVADTFADKQAAREAIEDYLTAAKEPAATRNAKKLSALELTLPEAAEADSALLPAATQTLQAATQAFIDNNADVIDAQQNARQFSSILFWAMAVLVGTVQGGIQAVSRSFFGKLIPKHRSNEFFGFFDIFGKFASVLGPFLYAAVGSMTGRSSWGTLCLLALFIIGFIILYRAKAPLEQLTANAD
ncbi:MAG TPA: MFS transporter, partial [Clostridiales bacterium]|nr:MFS transporter [Clostridiales bacterium]